MGIPFQARSRYIDAQNYPLLMAIWEYPAQVLPYRLLAYSLRLSALALFGMTYSLQRWQIYWGLAIPISLDDSATAGGA